MNTAILTKPGPSRWLAAALGIAAAFTLGCILRRWVPRSSLSTPTQAAEPAPPASVEPPAARPEPVPGPLTDADFTAATAAFRAVRSSHTPEHDLLAAAEWLLNAARTTKDFQRLVDLINTVPSEALMEPIAMAAFTRWAAIDPEAAARAVDRVQSHQMKHGLADELSERVPKHARLPQVQAIVQQQRKARSEAAAKRIAAVTQLTGDKTAGEPLFTSLCLTCHSAGGKGIGFAPPLNGSNKRDLPALLQAMLEPDAAVENVFRPFHIRLRNGTELEGFLKARSGNRVTIQMMGGATQDVNLFRAHTAR